MSMTPEPNTAAFVCECSRGSCVVIMCDIGQPEWDHPMTRPYSCPCRREARPEDEKLRPVVWRLLSLAELEAALKKSLSIIERK